MHRPLAFLFAVLVLSATGASASAQAERRLAPLAPNATFVVTGHGWGHGVGMSQYGAYGFAQHGFTYAKIVAHYFHALPNVTAHIFRKSAQLLPSFLANLNPILHFRSFFCFKALVTRLVVAMARDRSVAIAAFSVRPRTKRRFLEMSTFENLRKR